MSPLILTSNVLIGMTFLIFILGVCIGSFLNVVADRWAQEKSIQGRSHCDFCKKTLSGLDLIPIISFILLSGRCRYCQKKLSLQYPLVEFFTGVLFVLFWLRFGFETNITGLIGYFILAGAAMVILITDFKDHIILDEAIVALLSASILIHQGNDLLPLLLSGGVTFLVLYALYFFSRGRAMGFGDVKLAFAIGFLLGLKAGLIALYGGFLLGGLVAIVLLLLGRAKMKSMIAFGPYLVISMLIMLFFNIPIVNFVGKFF